MSFVLISVRVWTLVVVSVYAGQTGAAVFFSLLLVLFGCLVVDLFLKCSFHQKTVCNDIHKGSLRRIF